MNKKVSYFHADGVPGDHAGLLDYWMYAQRKQRAKQSYQISQSGLALARFLALVSRLPEVEKNVLKEEMAPIRHQRAVKEARVASVEG